MTDISFRESNGRATTIKTGEVESGIVVPGVQLYAKDPTGNIVPVTADADGNFIISIGAVTVDNVEISNDTGSPIPVNSVQLPAALGTNGGLKVEANGAKNTATVARVSASATAVTLLAANANRRRVILYNDSSVNLRVKLGSAATATDFTYLLGGGDTYEAPTDWVYTGIITGIWDSATGAAQVTEI